MRRRAAVPPWWMYVGAASAAMAGVSFPVDPLLVLGPAIDWDGELARLSGGWGADGVSGR